MFWKKHTEKQEDYDKQGKIPVIRSSICTGEKVAGFKDEQTGKFQELMVIRTGEDMKRFLKMYGVREEEIKKEW